MSPQRAILTDKGDRRSRMPAQ